MKKLKRMRFTPHDLLQKLSQEKQYQLIVIKILMIINLIIIIVLVTLRITVITTVILRCNQIKIIEAIKTLLKMVMMNLIFNLFFL